MDTDGGRRFGERDAARERLRVQRLHAALPVLVLVTYATLLIDYGPHRFGLRSIILVLFLPLLAGLVVGLIYIPLTWILINPRDWRSQLWFGVFGLAVGSDLANGSVTGRADGNLYPLLIISILGAFSVVAIAEWLVSQMTPRRLRA